ncbi:endo alpha-1,4 polygalactosaminidase [Pseudoclavibacter sp. 8L]|uniref:endo alpha-1,4 polygalactosaminidase n=1 Tax=Pseudoclavibacter sp. 8L TaxID=2653162 RepID=UPI0012F1B140|nr:endo alpha-1,4 polygalactosaminidase [Pseudoclavibacter sp. 8L]VXC43595.1 conserved exported hypothetical protein [Pseudoclavibacter sp. 8L]
MRVFPAALLLVVSVFALSGCAQGGTKVSAESTVPLPPTSGTFDYQLGEPYDIDGGLDVVARDATAAPDSGAYSICYVNGFQTQPGESTAWLHERSELLLHDAAGQPIVDPDWPDEYILDPSTAEQRDGILDVMAPIITGCAESGFDAVEIDNLDTFTRFDASTSGGGAGIDESGALELAAAYVDAAHAAGLAIGQKNAAELADRGRAELGFDFAVAEECGAYGECDAYASAYGDLVLQIEYTDDLAGSPEQVCADDSRAPLTVIRDRDLGAPDASDYFRLQC